MFPKKEHYRNFEIEKLIFMAGPETGGSEEPPKTEKVETQETPEEKAEQLKEKSGDLREKIKEHENRVHTEIDKIQKMLSGSSETHAESFAEELKTSTSKKFDELSARYEAQRKEIGDKEFNKTNKGQELMAEANKLAAKIIANEIQSESAVEASVDKFLDSVPNAEATKEEVDYIKPLVEATLNPNEISADIQTELIEAFAKKYDIKFIDGKVAYAIDTSQINNPNNLTVLNPDDLNRQLESALSVIKGKDNAESLTKSMNKNADELLKLREEIDEGRAFVAKGGEITEWEDWKGHEAVQELNRAQEYINKYLEDHPDSFTVLKEQKEAEQKTKEEAEKEAKIKAELEERFGDKDVKKPDEKEVEAINEMEITIGEETQKFSDLYPKSLANIISADHEIKKTEDGKLQIKDGEEFKDLTAENLSDYLPESVQTAYAQKLNGSEEFNEEDFEKELNKEEKAREQWNKLQEIAKDPKKVKESFKKMGIVEMLTALGQMFKHFKKALETGDYQSLNDAVKDFNEGKNPAESMAAASETYNEKVDGIKDTGKLLSLYQDPYGEKEPGLAKELFEGTPYRIQLKNVIEEKLEAVLGIDISDMKNKTASITTIEGVDGNRKVKISLERKGEDTLASMDANEMNEDGSLGTTKNVVAKTEVKDLSSGTDSLSYVLFKREVKAENEDLTEIKKRAEELQKKSEEKYRIQTLDWGTRESGFVDNKDGKFIINSKIGNKQIQDIFDRLVKTAKIKVSANNKTEGVEANQIVDVEKKNGTYVLKGTDTRLQIYEGDEIISLELVETNKEETESLNEYDQKIAEINTPSELLEIILNTDKVKEIFGENFDKEEVRASTYKKLGDMLGKEITYIGKNKEVKGLINITVKNKEGNEEDLWLHKEGEKISVSFQENGKKTEITSFDDINKIEKK